MKRIIVPIIIVISAVMLTACAADNASAQAADDATSSQLDAQENTQENNTLNAVYEQLASSSLLPEMIASDKSSYNLCASDYSAAVCYKSSDESLPDEIVLVTAVDDEAAERIEEALYTWLEDKAEEAKSSSKNYEIITACSVERSGNNLALIISAKAEQLTNIYLENIN